MKERSTRLSDADHVIYMVFPLAILRHYRYTAPINASRHHLGFYTPTALSILRCIAMWMIPSAYTVYKTHPLIKCRLLYICCPKCVRDEKCCCVAGDGIFKTKIVPILLLTQIQPSQIRVSVFRLPLPLSPLFPKKFQPLYSFISLWTPKNLPTTHTHTYTHNHT